MRSYHLYDGEGDMGELSWVQPIPDPKLRLVAMSEQDAEILRLFGHLHQQLGTPHADVLTGLAAAWKIGMEQHP